MDRIFARDIVISVLLGVILALILREAIIAFVMWFPFLFVVLGIEEMEERIIRYIHIRRTIERLIPKECKRNKKNKRKVANR